MTVSTFIVVNRYKQHACLLFHWFWLIYTHVLLLLWSAFSNHVYPVGSIVWTFDGYPLYHKLLEYLMPWYLSGQSFMTRLKLAWKELVKGTMNIGKMKRVGLQMTWVRKRTKYQMCTGRHGIQVGHKPCGTLRQLSMPPKDPLPNSLKSDVVYRADCKGCTAYYVGETRKTLQSQICIHQGAV